MAGPLLRRKHDMAVGREIDSFMCKFRSLCDAGYQASLNFNHINGQAQLSLTVNLGCAVNETLCNQYQSSSSPHYKSPRKRPPSYFRRQQRRRQVFSDQSAEQAVTDKIYPETTEEIAIGNGNVASETSRRNDEPSIDPCAVTGDAAEECMQLVVSSLSSESTPFDTTPSVTLPCVQNIVSSSKEKQPLRSSKQDRPSPRPNPECCDHQCYPEPDAPDGKCCWHRCGRNPWPWQI